MKTFTVRGYCLVPAVATMEVRAKSEQAAMKQAKRKFKSREKRIRICDNLISDNEAFDWEPTSADEEVNRAMGVSHE